MMFPLPVVADSVFLSIFLSILNVFTALWMFMDWNLNIEARIRMLLTPTERMNDNCLSKLLNWEDNAFNGQ